MAGELCYMLRTLVDPDHKLCLHSAGIPCTYFATEHLWRSMKSQRKKRKKPIHQLLAIGSPAWPTRSVPAFWHKYNPIYAKIQLIRNFSPLSVWEGRAEWLGLSPLLRWSSHEAFKYKIKTQKLHSIPRSERRPDVLYGVLRGGRGWWAHETTCF